MAQAKGRRFSLGVDFGTNRVRALIVDAATGEEIATSGFNYPSGDAGVLLDRKDPNLARQNPADYLVAFQRSVRAAVRHAGKVRGFSPSGVIGVGVDTTGSTPIPVDRDGTPLAMHKEFAARSTRRPSMDRLAAQAWLWKDHTAHAESAEITDKARKSGAPYLTKCGGTYSPEWFWSKIWHCQRTSPRVFDAAYSWVELADFIPAHLTGNLDPLRMTRSICAAGHKAMYNDHWGGLPEKKFLRKLSPKLARLRDRLYDKAVPADRPAGHLTEAWAKKVGLPAGIPVAVGALDAHAGAVGSGVKPGALAKVLGTSSCDMMVAPAGVELPDIPGLCGIVPGSIIPGMIGLEAGQCAVGDIYNWYVSYLCPAAYARGDGHANLTREARKLKPGASGLLALDWNNGNRCILADPMLTGLLVGQTLHTTAPEIYRALVEATAFGALTIILRFEEYGVAVREIVNCGGIAEKNDFVMQVYADVCNRPMKLSRSAQSSALGAAIFGAVVGGAYRTAQQAQRRMTGVKAEVFRPRKANAVVYAELYKLYRLLHDAFGTPSAGIALNRVMKELIAIRDRVRRQ